VRLMREHLGIDVDALSEDVFTSSERPGNVRRGSATHFGGCNSGSGPAPTD